MATFLPGIQDEITPVQVYKPDYAFLTQVYGQRQAEYDRGFNMVKSLYNSMLSSPLSSESNERYRQEVLKKLQSAMKSTAGIDLSNPTNVMRAMELMDPISKDQEIAYDMGVTNYLRQQEQIAQQYKNSQDPEQRARYNEKSVRGIQFVRDDLRQSTRGDGSITKVQPVDFVPQEDIAAYLNKAAKEQGIEVTVAQADGRGYIITQTNGKMSHAAFNQWAKNTMGNRFDRQINQAGWVDAESTIRNTMQSQNISREQALNQVSSQMAEDLLSQQDAQLTAVDKDLKNLNDEIQLFKKNYPKGIPASKAEYYQKLVADRDAHVNEHDGLNSSVKNLRENGASWVAENIHTIFSQNAKDKVARDWAVGYSNAKVKYDIKSDETVLTNWRIKSQESIAAANRALEWQKFKLKYDQDERFNIQKNEIEMLKLTADGKIPSQTYLGQNTEQTDMTGADVIQKSMTQNSSQLFNSAFGAGNGLINMVVGAANHGQYYSVLKKVQTIAQTGQGTLSEADKQILIELGKQTSTQIIDPSNNAAFAKSLLDNLAAGTYETARNYVSYYSKHGKTKEIAEMMPSFNSTLSSMTTLMTQREQLNSNYKRIAGAVADEYGRVKPGFEAVKIVGYLPDNTPIYDISGLEQSKKDFLKNYIDSEFTDRARTSGDVLQYNGIPAGMMYAVADAATNSAASVVTSDGSKIAPEALAKMAPSAIKELFGGSAQVTFKPQSEKVMITMKVDPSSQTAKTLKISNGDTVTVEIPYSYVEANKTALEDIYKYLNKNSVDPTSLGSLSPFLTNRNARVEAPSYMERIGFDYSIAGVEDNTGAYGLGMTFSYYNPSTQKEESKYIFKKIDNPNNPESYTNAQRVISDMYENYITQKVKHDDSFVDENFIPYND
jgi:hypothetical protein